jgi:predicted nucleotidyltransferase
MLTARERDQLDEAAGLVATVIGPDLLGLYLHGSAVIGGLHPDSDLDVLGVSRRATSRREKQLLVDRMRRISRGRDAPDRARRVELTLVVHGEVRPWRYPPRFDFQYGNWLLDDFDRGELEPWPAANPDVAILLTGALAADRALFGPPLGTLVGPVPAGDLRRALADELPGLLGDLETDTRNILLTLARIWTTLATGEIRSKDGAADWALDRLAAEHRAVIALARDGYLGGGDERWNELLPDVRAAAASIEVEIERLATEAEAP